MDRSELATWIVRMGEKYPDRVGLKGLMATEDCSDHCISGQILHDLGHCKGKSYVARVPFSITWGATCLSQRAASLNNDGVPWGEIPKRLGLVPGEIPAETPIEQPLTPETVTAAKEEVHAAV